AVVLHECCLARAFAKATAHIHGTSRRWQRLWGAVCFNQRQIVLRLEEEVVEPSKFVSTQRVIIAISGFEYSNSSCRLPEIPPMHRTAVLCLSTFLLSAGVLLLSMNACGGSTNIPTGKFQHVVIIFQENRTPDNLFHDPGLIAKGADIASSGMNSAG